MFREEIVLKVKPLISGHLEKRGYCLVDLRLYTAQGPGLVFEVLADRAEGGITLDECTTINRELGELLETDGGFQENYTLDVSSPGLDRPLSTVADFKRTLGRDIRIFLKEGVQGKIEYRGIIENATDEKIFLKTIETIIEIPLDKVNKAKQVIT